MRPPFKPLRGLQRAALRAGALRAPLARHDGDGPRFLVRVDEFPYGSALDHPEHGTELAAGFHAIMRAAGLPYLLAVLPRVARDYLDPAGVGWRELEADELALLAQARSDGVQFAQHGLDHRTTRRRARARSEFAGLSVEQAAQRLDEGHAILAAAGIETRAFVPPFNRFDARHWPLLRDRYEIVCGGPETVSALGLQALQRDGQTTYVPSYPPFYGRSDAILEAVQPLLDTGAPVTVPITLHTIWEMDGHSDDLRRLCEVIAPRTAPWDSL